MDPSAPAPAPTPTPTPLPQQPNVPGVPAPGAPKGLAITALVLGSVAFLFGWLGLFSIFGIGNVFTALAAVVFGAIALVKRQSKGMAVTGLVLGAVGLIATIGFMIISTIGYASLSEKAKENAAKVDSSPPSLFDDYEQ